MNQPKPLPTPRPYQGQAGGKNTAYTMQRRLLASKVHEFELLSTFNKQGYRNREDITILPPGVLVKGSYNVLTNVGGRIGVAKGYTLDGQANTSLLNINSAFDFTKILSNDRHVRTYNGIIEYRYVNPVTGIVTWNELYSLLVPGNAVNYTSYWDNTQLTTDLLFVNETPFIYLWSGAIAAYASSTFNTITKSGAENFAELGFDTTAGSVHIDGVDYAYTGGTGTTTLTGVSPDPTGAGIVVGDAIAQTVTVVANSAMTTISATFNNGLIGNLDNQVFVGALDSSTIYTSKVNDFTDYSNSTPRLVGQGATSTILDYPTAFINQDDKLQVSAGKDIWYQTVLTNTTNTTADAAGAQTAVVYQSLTYDRLKTTSQQASQSQAATTKIKNNIAYLSFEPIVNTLGTVANYLNSPQTTDMSFPIVNDMNGYDLTDASMIYFRQYLYLSVPKEGLIRIYNMTQPKDQYWEAPVTYPIGRFSIIDDQLYGHGYSVPETYKLFDGYQFRGKSIPAAAYFSYNQYGTRAYPKDFNLFYLEGYITSNTTLTYGFNYDIDGCQTQRTYTLEGSDTALVCLPTNDASLGKAPLGSRPLSGLTVPPNSVYSTSTGLPPKFRAIKQLSKFPFYELQVFFTSLGSDLQWEIVAFGPNAGPATESNNARQY